MKSSTLGRSLLAVLVLGGAYAFSQLGAGRFIEGTGAKTPSKSGVQSAEGSAQPEDIVPFVEFEGPLYRGRKIPLEVATVLLQECSCPQLPSEGPASSEHVVQSWFDPGLGKVAFEFDHGLTMIFSPDGGTAEEYVASVQGMIDAGDWVGHFLPLRNTTAAGTDILENGRLATLNWVEGVDIVGLYGEGGQTLAELTSIAESLVYAS